MFAIVLLFFVLSPGVLLTLPSAGRGIFMSGQTSLLAAFIHALLFAYVLAYRRQIPVLRDILAAADQLY